MKRGTLEAPEEGATIVYVPDTLVAPPGPDTITLNLTGPGITDSTRLTIAGIPPAECAAWQTLIDFPLGVEIWLAAADGTLAVIPRSTRWTLKD